MMPENVRATVGFEDGSRIVVNSHEVAQEIWVAAATYVQPITLKSGVALYGGFAGTETAREQRNRTPCRSGPSR